MIKVGLILLSLIYAEMNYAFDERKACEELRAQLKNQCTSQDGRDVRQLTEKIDENLQHSRAIGPEDGNMLVRNWYYGNISDKDSEKQLRDIAVKEGFSLKPMNEYNEYIQDMAFFSESGELILNANMPLEDEILYGLTRNIFDNPDGVPELNVLTARNAKTINRPCRQMEWTFLEGGGVISGKLTNGETYVVITDDGIERTKAFWKQRNKTEISDEQAIALIAKDLGIKEQNVFSVPVKGHIDLVMMALPGGKIVLNDPSQTVSTLEEILKDESVPDVEKKRLRGIIKFYKDGFQRHFNDGRPMGTVLYPFRKDQQNELVHIEKRLKDRLEIIKVPGAMREVTDMTNSTGTFSDQINFLNGFVGKNSKGEVFVITNRADGLSSLEKFWKKKLSTLGVQPEHVYFPGKYSMAQGVDCWGAIAP